MMKKWLSLFLVCVLLLCSCTSEQEKYQEQYDLGIRYLSEGNYEEAIIAFTAAIEIDPKRVDAYMGRGDAYAGTAEVLLDGVEDKNDLPFEVIDVWEKTVADYLTAIELDKTLVEAYTKAVQIYSRLGDDEAAIALLEQGIDCTGNERLQSLLDELKNKERLAVVTYQAAYRPDGSLWGEFYYFYDEAGYLMRGESYYYNKNGIREDGSRIEWIYDDELEHWWRISSPPPFGQDAKQAVWYHEPGSKYNVTTTAGDGDGNVCCLDPLLLEEAIYEADGIYYNTKYDTESESADEYWHHATYTFDDRGYPVATQTYDVNGKLLGTGVIEWTIIRPVASLPMAEMIDAQTDNLQEEVMPEPIEQSNHSDDVASSANNKAVPENIQEEALASTEVDEAANEQEEVEPIEEPPIEIALVNEEEIKDILQPEEGTLIISAGESYEIDISNKDCLLEYAGDSATIEEFNIYRNPVLGYYHGSARIYTDNSAASGDKKAWGLTSMSDVIIQKHITVSAGKITIYNVEQAGISIKKLEHPALMHWSLNEGEQLALVVKNLYDYNRMEYYLHCNTKTPYTAHTIVYSSSGEVKNDYTSDSTFYRPMSSGQKIEFTMQEGSAHFYSGYDCFEAAMH